MKQAAFAFIAFVAFVSMTVLMSSANASKPASSAAGAAFPKPEMDDALASAPAKESLVLAGGCFWGVQAVFQHVKGVTRVTSGYAGGAAKTASYHVVSSGATGHAESVEIVYDPSQISYGQLLRVFFSVAHDPTEKNRQGPDEGPQYRSAIFYTTPRQQEIAKAYIAQLDGAKIFKRPIATEVSPLSGFYAAEDYHQDYATKNPFDPYIMVNDRPKVNNLQSQYPDLFVSKMASSK
jgi:peptide-methionine (S)-S-oxide reductase